MVAEAAQVVDEGIALRPIDVDAVFLNGYGFPPYRGGPMFWADTIGLDVILEALLKYKEQHGAVFWEPSPLLAKLAAEGKGFKDWEG